MQKHPLLTVKEAAEKLRLDERSVRERLANGQLRGEKKQMGLREKWFVYSGSVEAAITKQDGPFSGEPDLSATAEEVTIESETISDSSNQDDETLDFTPSGNSAWLELNRKNAQVFAEEVIKPLMQKLEAQQQIIFEQKQNLIDQERQLKLLPDLERRAESERKEAEAKALEVEALNKQIQALKEQQQQSETKILEAEALKKQIEVLEEKQALAIEQERQAVEEAHREAEESGKRAQELADEMEKLKSEKDAAIQEQLAALTKQLHDLQKPKASWWQKWFTAGGEEQK